MSPNRCSNITAAFTHHALGSAIVLAGLIHTLTRLFQG